MPFSDWIVYGTKAWDVFADSSTFGRLADAVIDAASDADVAAALETMRDDAAAFTDGADPTPFTFHTLTSAVEVAYDVGTSKTNNSGTLDSTALVTRLVQSTVTFDCTFCDDELDDFPPLLDTLVEGVDYELIPGTSDYVEYESSTTTFLGWADKLVTFSGTSGGQRNGSTGDVPFLTDITVPDFNINLFVFAPPETLYWPAWAPGSALDVVTITGLLSPFLSGFSQDETVPFSAITDETFVVALQPDFLNTTPFPLTNLTMPTTNPGFADFVQEELAVTVGVHSEAFGEGFGALQALYALPRFRYYIPDQPVELRTVGGYWASVGGPAINMKQPDGTWVPITDVN